LENIMFKINASATKADLKAYIALQDAELITQGRLIEALRSDLSHARATAPAAAARPALPRNTKYVAARAPWQRSARMEAAREQAMSTHQCVLV